MNLTTTSVLLVMSLMACTSADPRPPAEASSPAKSSAPAESPAPAATPPSDAPKPTGDCTLTARTVAAPTLHADLLAVAPQYFHGTHRGGFDAYSGGKTFPWFDRHQLDAPVLSPPGARIAASTATRLLPVKHSGELGHLPREGGRPTWLGKKLYPEEAIDGANGTTWVLARSGRTWQVVELDAEGKVKVHDLGIAETTHDVRIAINHAQRPAAAWLAREGGQLSVHLAMDFDVSTATVVDAVTVPDGVAELSHRTGVNLALVAQGPDALAVAWRPLVDQKYTDFGSRSKPPSTPAAAEVRWRTLDADGSRSTVHVHPTSAQPLGFTSGIGPWALRGNGMKSGSLGRDAPGVFVWLDDEVVRGVRADQDTTVALTEREGSPLLAPRATSADPLQLLLFDSSPRVRALALDCR